MVNKCLYCKSEIPVSSVLSVCKMCGIKVWGKQMYEAIESNMSDAKESGNLEQGNIK